MTGNSVWMIGGVAAHQWLAHERGRLAARLVERLVNEVEHYRRLPREELAHDIVAVVEANLYALSEALREQRVPPMPGGRVAETAVRGAEQGMPPGALLDAYHLAFAQTWRAMTAQAGRDDLADVLACTSLMLDYTRRVTELVASTYFDERSRLSGEEQDARFRLTSALLSGEPADAHAARAGVRLAPSYVVLSLSMEESTAVTTRRRLQRMMRELDTGLPLLDGAGGTVLLPWPGAWEQVELLVGRVEEAARTAVTAAAGVAVPEDVPAEVRRTREILDVVRWFGRGPGLYRLSDVLVEYQLTRQTAATDGLAALLDPLSAHQELLLTLETHLRCGRARRETAEALHLHPNTVDYRLRKVARLTGLDVADDAHLQRIGAALAARRTSTSWG